MKANIYITLKQGVLDPQGKAIQTALSHLGFDNVEGVRQGKFIEVSVNAQTVDAAKTQVESMCKQLLANTVIENYRYDIIEA